MGNRISYRATNSTKLIKKLIFSLLIVLMHANFLYAQEDNRRCVQFRHSQQQMRIDSVLIEPNSLIITDRYGDTLFHRFNSESRILELEKAPDNEPILICFRILALPDKLDSRYVLQTDSSKVVVQVPATSSSIVTTREELFSTGDIEKTGVLSRGITFGNTQNVFVSSVLNLQMEGALTDNLFLRAAITDQRVPFQPEGNTLQIQEFDRVFLEVYNDNLSLTAGDVVFQNPESNFLRYYKNVQGGLFRSNYKIGEKSEAETYVGASLAKGKFASTVVEALEGVSGPYRLRGPEDQRFIVVMANSEKVFVDGRQLQRGFDYDYVIDYNLAEITFMPKVLITRYTRIRVDFEYADQNFSRSIITAGHSQQLGKFELSGNFYREQDNRNRPLLTELSLADQELLSEIGDNIDAAFRESATLQIFNPNQIQYFEKDTLLADGQQFRIFARATSELQQVYSVSFTEVGQGGGDYRIRRTTENGRVFEWVAPQNGISTGNYAPISTLPVPNKREMATFGTRWSASERDQLYVETAFSFRDRNLYSEIDNENNNGQAIKLGYETTRRPISLWRDYSLSANANAEYNSKDFQFIDRLRSIEFDRDWSLDPRVNLAPATEQIFTSKVNLIADGGRNILYQFVARNRGDVVNGILQSMQVNEQFGPIRLQSDAFIMRNSLATRDAEWNRAKIDLSYRNAFLSPGYRYEVDRNAVRAVDRDSVISTAMNFQEQMIYLESQDTAKVQFRVSQSWREDKLPFFGELSPESRAQNSQVNLQTRGKSQDINLVLTYRQLENLLPMAEERWEQTLLGRVDWLGNFWNNNIRSELSYQVGDGRELLREFIFLQVPTGEGTHTWRDENGDGIQDLNEFYEAINADEKNYIKVFVPTDEYTRAFTQNFNYRLNIGLPQAWKEAGGWRAFASRFSNISSYALDKKIIDDEIAARLLPSIGISDQEDILSYRKLIRSSFFFNRAVAKYGADFNISQSERQQLLTQGFEEFRNNEYRLNMRYSIDEEVNVLFGLFNGQKSTVSDFLSLRNYTIDSHGFKPELSWQPSLQMRLSASYGNTYRENMLSTEGLDEFARINEWMIDFRFMKVNKTTLSSNVRYLNIDFEGIENSPAGYELLQALRPGNNFTWSLALTQRLLNGLQIGLNYEGRKSPNQTMIHTGRMQVSALF